MTKIDTAQVERYMQIVQDLKKELHYFKSSGEWSWVDRGETDPVNMVGPFKTWLDAVYDIVEPYVAPESQGDPAGFNTWGPEFR